VVKAGLPRRTVAETAPTNRGLKVPSRLSVVAVKPEVAETAPTNRGLKEAGRH